MGPRADAPGRPRRLACPHDSSHQGRRGHRPHLFPRLNGRSRHRGRPRRPAPGARTAAEQPARPAVLPAPTGPHAVGSTVLPLVDQSRTDPWVPTADGRALMVTLHYPAARSGGGAPAPYATREEARLLAEQLGPGVSGDVLARTRTHSRTDVRPAPGRHPWCSCPRASASPAGRSPPSPRTSPRAATSSPPSTTPTSRTASASPAAAPSPASPARPSTRAGCTGAWSPRPAPPT